MTARPPLSAAELEAMRARCELLARQGTLPNHRLLVESVGDLPRLLDELERCRKLLVNVLQGDPSRDPTADAWEYLDQAGVWTALRSRHPDAR